MTVTTYTPYLGLGQLIARLEEEDPNLVLPLGFAEPHSFRGYYHELGFEPRNDISIADMLAAARSALGATFEGWKGGEYEMSEHTDCWLAYWGDSSDNQIGPVLLELLIAQGHAARATSGEAGERSDTPKASDLGGSE